MREAIRKAFGEAPAMACHPEDVPLFARNQATGSWAAVCLVCGLPDHEGDVPDQVWQLLELISIRRRHGR